MTQPTVLDVAQLLNSAADEYQIAAMHYRHAAEMARNYRLFSTNKLLADRAAEQAAELSARAHDAAMTILGVTNIPPAEYAERVGYVVPVDPAEATQCESCQ